MKTNKKSLLSYFFHDEEEKDRVKVYVNNYFFFTHSKGTIPCRYCFQKEKIEILSCSFFFLFSPAPRLIPFPSKYIIINNNEKKMINYAIYYDMMSSFNLLHIVVDSGIDHALF